MAKSLWIINFSAAYDLRHYQHVDRLLKSVPTPPHYQYLLVTGAKNTHQTKPCKNTKKGDMESMLDSAQQAPFFLLRCNSGKSKCHASQGHLCSHSSWTPLVLNTFTIHSWYLVWHQRHLVTRLCHHLLPQIHLCSRSLCARCLQVNTMRRVRHLHCA